MNNKQKSALLTSLAVFMYITCVIPVILSDSDIAVCIMFLLIGLATAILVYNSAVNKRAAAQEGVEQASVAPPRPAHSNTALKSATSLLWVVTVIVYIALSFATMDWGITWIVFLIAAAVEQIIKLVLNKEDEQ